MERAIKRRTIFLKKPEFYLAIFFFSFVLLKPVLVSVGSYSRLVLVMTTLLVIFIYFLFCKVFFTSHFILSFVIFASAFALFFLINFIFNRNDKTIDYLVDFVVYALIPVLFVSRITSLKSLLYYFYIFSILSGLLIATDPFFNYRFTSGYMSYGFSMLFYSILGLFLAFFVLKKKWVVLLIVPEILLVFAFGNKGAFISIIPLFIVLFLTCTKNKPLKFCLLVFAIMFFVFWNQIIGFFVDVMHGFGLNSYSLTTFDMMVNDNSNQFFGSISSRREIWVASIKWIEQYPLFGSGIGTFEVNQHGYTHNIFLDIGVTFGLLGLLIFVIILICSLVRIYKLKDRFEKVFLLSLFMCWIVSMQFSLTFWSEPIFWLYWIVLLFSKKSVTNRVSLKEDDAVCLCSSAS